MSKSYEMDMCHGRILPKVLEYSFPLILSGMLQLLFNAADVVVVGKFAGNESLAAVGSTSPLVNLLITVFIGLSIGANVLAARYFGAKNDRDLSLTVHTSIALSLISGVFLTLFGVLTSSVWLKLMGTPDDVIDKAVLYMRIYSFGMTFQMLFNFGSAILRAIGDTKRPLYFLTFAGILNVVFNLIFVIHFHMDVAGVAAATAFSEFVSAVLVIRCLLKSEGALKLIPKKIRIDKRKLGMILKVGLTAGFQGALFAVSNVLIQSSVNSFGAVAMAGNTAASNLEGFVYNAMQAVYQTNLSFTSQNVGAEKYTRINKILLTCQGTVIAVGLAVGLGVVFLADPLLSIYSSDPQVIEYGKLRILIICSTYFLCGIMDTMDGTMRGLGYSLLPMFVSLTGACLFRVVWILTVFEMHRSLTVLYIAYPITWILTGATHLVCYLIARRKIPKKDGIGAAA